MVERKNQESTEYRAFHNGILVTDDQGTHFPIFHFDLVVIVEPDQSKWMPDREFDLDNALEEIWDIQCEMISHEAFSDETLADMDSVVNSAEETRFLWQR
jgi:hypothetical protein